MAGLGPMQMKSSAAVSESLGCTGAVRAGMAAISSAFTANGASMPTQAAGDLGISIALPLHSIYDISFVHGKMAVRHREHSVV
jgi:hypothetical protein